MATKNFQLQEKQADGSEIIIHPETKASNVLETSDKKVMTAEERTNLAQLVQMKENDEFGKVDDVRKKDGTSIVVNKIATLPNFAELSENGKIQLSQLPDSILGQLLFGGFIDRNGLASITTDFKEKYGILTNTFQLVASDYATYKSVYFIAEDEETFTNQTIIGIENVSTGDWIVSLGTKWGKVDNTDAVTSVNGKTGNVQLGKEDVGLNNVDNTADVDKVVKSAGKLTNNKNINITGDVSGVANTDFSSDVEIAVTLPDIVAAGTYSAVNVNAKGQITKGAQVIEVGAPGQTTPSASLAVGGIFFKEIE